VKKDAVETPDTYHGNPRMGNPITDKRKRDANNRKQAGYHAHVNDGSNDNRRN
jgi:hypothetical protein